MWNKIYKLKWRKTRGSQEPESLTWLKSLYFKGNKLTTNCPTILTQEDFGRTIIRIISAIESFFLSIIVFKILAENCFDPWIWRPYNKGNFSNWNNFVWPLHVCSFLVMVAMFFDSPKFPTSVLCRIPQETFIPSLVPIGQVV